MRKQEYIHGRGWITMSQDERILAAQSEQAILEEYHLVLLKKSKRSAESRSKVVFMAEKILSDFESELITKEITKERLKQTLKK